MDDEFKLCWKNFQDNIASGFQNLYDRGDLVDVTLACDGKLLRAHKIVLAICSPYFQEIFITNPCKHPIIILKDVTFNIMCELLEFMYQGVVNVKHTELQSFMKIGQLLQIRGLATNSSSSAASTTSEKSTSQQPTNNNAADETNNASSTSAADNHDSNAKETKSDANCSSDRGTGGSGAGGGKSELSPASSPLPFPMASPSLAFAAATLSQQSFKSSPDSNTSLHHGYHGGAGGGLKRHSDFSTDALSIYSRKQFRRSAAAAAAAAVAAATEHSGERSEHSASETAMDQVNVYDLLPQISMAESRYELNHVKRENDHHTPTGAAGAASTSTGAAGIRNSFGSAFCLDYNLYKNNSGSATSQQEYPNELHMPNDYSKNFGNHMDIPPNSSSVVMLSSTSLLHGSCVFNRNNTVATQQGMKTYWLCKSYRISMCRARCITHQGRVISATGVHNHPPHMRAGSAGSGGGVAGAGSSSGATPPVAANSGYDGATQVGAGPTLSNSGGMSATPSFMTGPHQSGTHANSSNSNTMPPNVRLTHNAASSNVYQQNLHAAPTQQQHQDQHGPTLSPPPTPQHAHPLHQHAAHSLPNLLIQHSSGSTNNHQANMHHNHHHHHHHHQQQQHTGPSLSMAQSQNSVIQNMMHSANAMMHLPNMTNMPPLLPNHVNQHHGNQHSPHLAEHSQAQHQHQSMGSNLEITPLMQQSPGHMQSPSNRSIQSHHGANSISPPTPAGGGGGVGPTTSSPNHSAHMNEDARHNSEHIGDQQQLLVHSDDLSPTEMNSNAPPSVDANSSLQAENREATNESHHQAHVIDSITISPGTAHTFKMEDM